MSTPLEESAARIEAATALRRLNHALMAHRADLATLAEITAIADAVATLETMASEGIVEHAARIGSDILGPGLATLAKRHPCIGDVRGTGVFWALELVIDRDTKEPLAPYGGTSPAMAELTGAMRSEGLLPFVNFNLSLIHISEPTRPY